MTPTPRSAAAASRPHVPSAPEPAVTAAPTSPPWRPDQGNGQYRNPVLFADYSDPDAIRVGDDFWLTASSFGHVPGLPILHSRDLVNWTLVNHALPQLVPVDHFSTPRHGQGVWAPSIRHHAGRFWIYYPDPDFGIHVVTAEDPRGQWSEPVLVKAGRGLIDPCPFWDEEGSGYLVHAWARSRAGINNRVTLLRLRADGLGVAGDDAGETIIDGDRLEGWNTIEGPKLYRRNQYYYVFAPAGGVTDGYQAVFRSRHIHGPYAERIVLARGTTAVNGPHQGAWVDTPEGGDWFLHFQELPAYGRIVHLQPLRWHNDWPVIGADPDGAGTGEPVPGESLPRQLGLTPTGPATSDEFNAPDATLGRQWQWQANPRADWASLRARPGVLRLQCVREAQGGCLWNAPHLLMQKFPAPEFEVTTRLEFSSGGDDDVSGLVVFGFSYAWLGRRGRSRLVYCICDDAHQGGREREVASFPVPPGAIELRVRVTHGARCSFAFRAAGAAGFTPVGDVFGARSSYWVGAKVGLFASARGGADATAGHADFDWFRVTRIGS